MKHEKNNPVPTRSPESVRTSLNLSGIKQDLNENLQYILGKPASMITLNDQYLAVAYSVRNRMIQYWMNTVETFFMSPSKAVCYFSA
jgi:starch phosphorylase